VRRLARTVVGRASAAEAVLLRDAAPGWKRRRWSHDGCAGPASHPADRLSGPQALAATPTAILTGGQSSPPISQPRSRAVYAFTPYIGLSACASLRPYRSPRPDRPGPPLCLSRDLLSLSWSCSSQPSADPATRPARQSLPFPPASVLYR
jgi:hypothetical protein